MASLEEDVLGLDVPVDNALGVGIPEGVGDLPGDLDGLVHEELPLARHSLTEGLPFDERHDIEDGASGLARIKEREDMAAGQPS